MGSTYSDASSAHATHNGATTVDTRSSASGGSDQTSGSKSNIANVTVPPPPTSTIADYAGALDAILAQTDALFSPLAGQVGSTTSNQPLSISPSASSATTDAAIVALTGLGLGSPTSSTPSGVYAVRSAGNDSNTTTTAPPDDSGSSSSSTGPGTDSPPDLLTSPPSYIPAHDDPGQFIRPGYWYGFDRPGGTYGWHPGSPPPGFTMGSGGWGPRYWSNRGTGNGPASRAPGFWENYCYYSTHRSQMDGGFASPTA